MKLLDRINRFEAQLLTCKILGVSLYSWLMFGLIVLGTVALYIYLTPPVL